MFFSTFYNGAFHIPILIIIGPRVLFMIPTVGLYIERCIYIYIYILYIIKKKEKEGKRCQKIIIHRKILIIVILQIIFYYHVYLSQIHYINIVDHMICKELIHSFAQQVHLY